MEHEAPHFVFEDERVAAVCAAWYPELGARVTSARAFVARHSPAPALEAETRERLVAALPGLTDETRAPALATLVQLREALVLSSDDAEFAFATLPQTPKNRALRQALLAYLESPLQRDTASEIWALIEALKNFEVTESLPSHVHFVRALDSSYLFSELAKAVRYSPHVAEAPLVEPWEVLLPEGRLGEPRRRAVLLEGPPARTVERAGTRLVRWIERGIDPDQVTLVVSADRPQEKLVGWLLRHHGLPFYRWDEDEAPAPPPSREAILLQALRRDSTKALRDRLRLGALVAGDRLGRRHDTPWEEYLAKLVAIERLSMEDAAYLTALVTHAKMPEARPEPERRGIAWLSSLSLPHAGDRKTLAVLGPQYLKIDKDTGLLRPAEIEALHQAGFPVSRPADRLERRRVALAELAAGGPDRAYLLSALDLEESLPGRKPRRLLAVTMASESDLSTSQVPFEPPPRLVLPKKPLSATQLETYAQCPAKYLFSSRLRLRREMGSERQYPLLLGQLVHAALETYFKTHETLPEDPREVQKGLLEAFHAVLAREARTLDASHPFHVILTEHFRRLVRHVPQLEKQLELIVGKARRCDFELPFALEIEGLNFKGKIDRLDETEEGARLVLDYKTGTVDFSPSHIFSGDHFQALLYWLASEKLLGKTCAGVLFYDLKKGELRRGVLLAPHATKDAKKAMTRGHVMDQESFDQIKTEGMRHLSRIAAGISEGDFRPTPKPGTCDFCEFPALCRKGLGYV